MILRVPDMLTPGVAEDAIAAIDEAAEQAIGETNGLSVDPGLDRTLAETMLENETLRDIALPREITGVQCVRLAPGTQIDHRLHDPLMPSASGGRLRADLVAAVFLDDPAACDGGELIVNAAAARRPVKLPVRSAAIFPATEPHRVAPVTRGVQHIAFAWIQSMVRRASQREILAEMWIVLDGIRDMRSDNAVGADEAFLHLSKARDNLIRMWAET